MESKDKKLSKREAINEYVKWLERQGDSKFFSKEELRRMKQSLGMAVNMLTSLPDEVDQHALNIALSFLCAYVAANGKDSEHDKIVHLATIVAYSRYTIEAESNPLAKVLDLMHENEKKHEDDRVMLHEILTIDKYI